MSEVRSIKLPKGGTLEVEVTPAFYDKVRQHFMLQPTQDVTDDHVRMFIYGVVDSAVNKEAASAKEALHKLADEEKQ